MRSANIELPRLSGAPHVGELSREKVTSFRGGIQNRKKQNCNIWQQNNIIFLETLRFARFNWVSLQFSTLPLSYIHAAIFVHHCFL